MVLYERAYSVSIYLHISEATVSAHLSHPYRTNAQALFYTIKNPLSNAASDVKQFVRDLMMKF